MKMRAARVKNNSLFISTIPICPREGVTKVERGRKGDRGSSAETDAIHVVWLSSQQCFRPLGRLGRAGERAANAID